MTDTSPTFDPAAFKVSTRREWDTVAEAWDRWTPTLRVWLDPLTETMLDLANLRPGDHVLDVAAGAGEPGLTAAERVGPRGFVLATDLSAQILSFAERAAHTRGLRNFATRVMDAEQLDLADGSFNVALSRLGIIFCPDRQRALAELRRVLRSGGRAVVAGFTVPDRNLFFTIPIRIIRRHAQLTSPTPDQPGPFSMGGPGVMEMELQQAGFSEVTTRIVSTQLRFPSASECVRFERESFGALSQMLAGVSETNRAAAWTEIEREFGQFESEEGFSAPTELVVGLGIKSA
jgi:ubiquinone/menaquinone biosynthesis C-methylase UbiE